LIRVKTGSNVISTGEITALAVNVYNGVAARQVVYLVALTRMGDQGEDLAVDPECTDTCISAVGKGFEEFAGIMQAQVRQVSELFGTSDFGLMRRRRATESDRCLDENAAQSQANHSSPLLHNYMAGVSKKGRAPLEALSFPSHNQWSNIFLPF
jgi:hypothetical protein